MLSKMFGLSEWGPPLQQLQQAEPAGEPRGCSVSRILAKLLDIALFDLTKFILAPK